MSFVLAYDVPGFNFSRAPQGAQLCGYDTGSGGVAWTPAMWAAHPGAVHIDQSPGLGGLYTSDVLDVERGAVPVGSAEIAAWVRGAQRAFDTAVRPGQRRPVLYQSASNVSANVNALVQHGITSGAGLWIARWDGNSAADIAALAAASGPFPVTGFQFEDDGPYDADVFSAAWLSDTSGDGWTFGPVRGAKFWPGKVTFGVSGYSPGVPEPLGVGSYDIVACKGTSLGVVATRYELPKDIASSAFSYEGHGLARSTTYTIGVRAVAAGGSHAGPWVTGTITTGS
jgi:hypothetical protein